MLYPYGELLNSPDEMIENRNGDKLIDKYLKLFMGGGVDDDDKIIKDEYVEKLKKEGTTFMLGPVKDYRIYGKSYEFKNDGNDEYVKPNAKITVDSASKTIVGGLIGDLVDMNPISFVGNWPSGPTLNEDDTLDDNNKGYYKQSYNYDYGVDLTACNAVCKPIKDEIDEGMGDTKALLAEYKKCMNGTEYQDLSNNTVTAEPCKKGFYVKRMGKTWNKTVYDELSGDDEVSGFENMNRVKHIELLQSLILGGLTVYLLHRLLKK